MLWVLVLEETDVSKEAFAAIGELRQIGIMEISASRFDGDGIQYLSALPELQIAASQPARRDADAPEDDALAANDDRTRLASG